MSGPDIGDSIQKHQAVAFLTECAEGRAASAYDEYLTDDFIHHNVFFPAEPESLAAGMDESAIEHPDRTYDVHRVLEDGDTVAVHGRVCFAGLEIAVIHMVRFANGRIAEMWDIAMPVPDDSPNENGPF